MDLAWVCIEMRVDMQQDLYRMLNYSRNQEKDLHSTVSDSIIPPKKVPYLAWAYEWAQASQDKLETATLESKL